MRTFAPKQNQPAKPSSSTGLARPTAAQQSLQSRDKEQNAELADTLSSSFRHDFSGIPLHPPAARATQPQPATGLSASEDGRESGTAEKADSALVSKASPPGSRFNFTRIPLTVQPLRGNQTIGSPDDSFEREADDVADRVMRMVEPGPIGSTPVAIQRKCVECVGKEKEDEEDERLIIQTKPASSAQPGAVRSKGMAMSAAERGGAPLSGDLRSFFEPRFGYDFSHVRIHSGGDAVTGARAVQARAYTIGHDIVFGSGEYAPATLEGKRLLAHELAHTLQQGSRDYIRRTPGPGDKPVDEGYVRRSITVPPGVTTRKQFLRYAETKIFNRVVNINWTGSTPGAQSLIDNPAKHVGETVTFRFLPSLVAGYKGDAPTAEEKAAGEEEYKALEPGERAGINTEINRRYYESIEETETPDTKIKKGEEGKAAIWNSFKAQVLADKQKLKALPDAIKALLGGTANMTPDKFSTLVRIADKLSPLSAADIEDYKSKTNAKTSDLAVLEASLDRYLAAKAGREKAGEERENIVTKLFGAEALYDAYKNLGKEWARLNKEARDKQVQGSGDISNKLRQQAKEGLQKEISDLNAGLKALGIANIQEFEKYLNDYEQAFLDETVAITLDVLKQYEHRLFVAEEQYSQDAAVDSLLAQVQGSGAPKLIAQAAQNMQEAKKLSSEGSDQTVQGIADIGNKLSNQGGRKMNEAQDLTAQASKLVKDLPGQPLIKDDEFPRAALLSNDRATAKAAILKYITDRRANIEESRANLRADPKAVYKLPKIMDLSYERQGVVPGSILDKLISDRRKEYIGDEAFWKMLLAVVGIALTVLTAGGGTIAVLAALGAAGISGYQAVEEYREYEKNSAFAGAGLADDPSFAWVIVAVVGAFADIGAAGAAINAVKAAGVVKALEGTPDLIKFEKSLASIHELNDAARANLIRAAGARVQALQSLQEIVLPTGKLYSTIPLMREAGHLTVAAVYAIKSGVRTFRAWLNELKAANVVADAGKLKPEELTALKAAWEEGRQYTKSIRENIPELEQAMKEFRIETGIERGLTSKGKVTGGTTGAAKAELEGVSQSIFKEGSTKTKGAKASLVKTNTRYGSPQSFPGTKNHAEQNILGDVADEIDKAKKFDPALKGQPKPGATGKIHLHVEQTVCTACKQGLNSDKPLGVIGQFSAEYPNITLMVTNAETGEVLFVRGGRVVKF